jgi:hypothetical protein
MAAFQELRIYMKGPRSFIHGAKGCTDYFDLDDEYTKEHDRCMDILNQQARNLRKVDISFLPFALI